MRVVTHRVEWEETRKLLMDGDRARCVCLLVEHPNSDRLVLVSVRTGKTEQWVADAA